MRIEISREIQENRTGQLRLTELDNRVSATSHLKVNANCFTDCPKPHQLRPRQAAEHQVLLEDEDAAEGQARLWQDLLP